MAFTSGCVPSVQKVHSVNVSVMCVGVHMVCCHRGNLKRSAAEKPLGDWSRSFFESICLSERLGHSLQAHRDIWNHLCSDGAVEARFSGESWVSSHTVAGCPVKTVGPPPQKKNMCLFTCEEKLLLPFFGLQSKRNDTFPGRQNAPNKEGDDFIQAVAVGRKFINEKLLKEEGANLAFQRAGKQDPPSSLPQNSPISESTGRGACLLCAPSTWAVRSLALCIWFSRSCPTTDTMLLIFASPPPDTVPALPRLSTQCFFRLPDCLFYSYGRDRWWCLTFDPWDVGEEMECQQHEKASLCGIQSSRNPRVPPHQVVGEEEM